MLPKNTEEHVYRLVQEHRMVIDPDGSVWRLTGAGRRRAENATPNGYLQVRAMFDGTRHHALAHRLAWLHFNGPIPTGLTINHIDGNKKNNRLDNLELATHSEQAIHSRRVLGNGDQGGEKNHRAKLTAEAVAAIRRRRTAGEPLKSIAADFGVTDRAISKIARGTRWAKSIS